MGTGRCWNVMGDDPSRYGDAHTNWIWSLEFLHDKIIFSGSKDKTIKIWVLIVLCSFSLLSSLSYTHNLLFASSLML